MNDAEALVVIRQITARVEEREASLGANPQEHFLQSRTREALERAAVALMERIRSTGSGRSDAGNT